MKKGREEKTKFSKMLPNNQIIIACRIELRVQGITINEKLTMIGLITKLHFFKTLRKLLAKKKKKLIQLH